MARDVIKSLEELRQWEDFYAYPGPALLNLLTERAASGDVAGTVRLARNISTAIVTHSYRNNVGEWDKEEEGSSTSPTDLPVSAEQKAAHRPYFEVLFVSPARQARCGENSDRNFANCAGRKTSLSTSRSSWAALKMRSWQ